MHATHPTLKYLENLDTMHPELEEMPQQAHGVNLGLFGQSPSRVQLFVTPMDCSVPGLPVPHHLQKFAQVHVIVSVMLSSHFILRRPCLLLPSVFLSIRDFCSQ